MPEGIALAIVKIRCDVGQLDSLRAIPNLIFQRPAMPTADANIKVIQAFADEAAQDQAKALGCEVTVIKSAQDYNEQIRNVYENISDKPIDIN
jgi:hypothetical protein